MKKFIILFFTADIADSGGPSETPPPQSDEQIADQISEEATEQLQSQGVVDGSNVPQPTEQPQQFETTSETSTELPVDTTVEPPKETTPELTFGMKAVGMTFNPGGLNEVMDIKAACAVVIDQLNEARSKTDSGDKKRMYSEAITAIQTGQMWGVKAATWQY